MSPLCCFASVCENREKCIWRQMRDTSTTFRNSVNSLLNSTVLKGNIPGTSVCVETYPRAGPTAADYGPGNPKIFFFYKILHNSLLACLFFLDRVVKVCTPLCVETSFLAVALTGAVTRTRLSPPHIMHCIIHSQLIIITIIATI